MPRKKKWPPVPHHHRASGQERIAVGSKHIYLGPIGSDEAKKKYLEVLASLVNDPDQAQQQQPPPPRPATTGRTPPPVTSQSHHHRHRWLTISELVDRWNEHAKARYSPQGREVVQFRLSLAPLVNVHGGTRVDAFSLQQLDEVREDMISRGWLRRVINRRMTRVRTMWRWAEAKGLVPPSSWAALSALAQIPQNDHRVPRSKPRRPVDWPTFARVCRHVKHRTARAMLLVLWYTGARPSEIRTLKVNQIDRSRAIWVARIEDHKNAWRGQEREIAIGLKAQNVLRPFLEGKHPCAWVFPSDRGQGKPYVLESLAKAVRRACERANVTGFTPYSCRHSFKQRAAREMGLDSARAALGQTSLDSTDRYAAGQDRKLAEEAARRLG